MKLHLKNAHAAIRKSWKESTEAAPPALRRRAKFVIFGSAILFIAIASYKYINTRMEKTAREAEIAAGPHVRVATVEPGIGEHRITLVGETRPFESATIYAKVSGYLKSVVVDKGDVVTQGQILAVIESPETDEGYLAAEADAKNKRAILTRMKTLFEKQLVSQQEFDQAQADSDVSSARYRSEQTLKSYETLRAPFPGTITARYADPGALVQAATAAETGALPIVTISQIRRLRIDIFIDQRDAPFVSKDSPVDITLPERPGYKLAGEVARVTGELDPRTKMLLTEIDIQNEDRSLVAGSFVQVSLLVKSPPYLQAPVEGLSLQGDKTFLTVVKPDNTLTFRQIQVASNDGKNLSILSGVEVGEKVALNIGSSLPEGSKIRPVEDEKPKTPPPAAAPSPVPPVRPPSTGGAE